MDRHWAITGKRPQAASWQSIALSCQIGHFRGVHCMILVARIFPGFFSDSPMFFFRNLSLKVVRQEGSKQASKQASKESSKPASKQANKPAREGREGGQPASKPASKQDSKGREGGRTASQQANKQARQGGRGQPAGQPANIIQPGTNTLNLP